MKENKVANYSVINLNTATLIQDGKPTNSVYPFNDLSSAITFVTLLLKDFKSQDIQRSFAKKYIMVDKECNQYRFEVIHGNLFVYGEGYELIARSTLKGDSK